MQIYSTKRNLKNNPIVENPFVQEYLFTEDEILMSYGEKAEYSSIQKMKVTKQFILLHSKDRKTYIVSMSGFKSKDDCDTLIQFMRNLKGKTKL